MRSFEMASQAGRGRMKKYWICLVCFLLAGCAYFENGATTRIRLEPKKDEAAFVNGRKLGDSTKELEISNKAHYQVEFKGEEKNRSEAVEKSLNPIIFGNSIVWPYFLVDLGLGSHLEIQDGRLYKVTGRGLELADDCEKSARRGLKASIIYTGAFLMGGTAIAIAGYAASKDANPSPMVEFQIPFGAIVGFVGGGYHVFKTSGKIREIQGCIEERIGQQPIFRESGSGG